MTDKSNEINEFDKAMMRHLISLNQSTKYLIISMVLTNISNYNMKFYTNDLIRILEGWNEVDGYNDLIKFYYEEKE